MPLSEREQRILEDIERSLAAQDPAFLKDSEPPRRRAVMRNVRKGALVFVAGIAMLIAFFVMRAVLVGVAAFGLMVGGIVIAAGALDALRMPPAARTWRQSKSRMNGRLDLWEQRLRDRYRRR